MAEVYTDYQKFLLTHGGVLGYGATTTGPNVTYHLWVEWTKGTGNNGSFKLFVSTTASKPAQPDAVITTGTGGAIRRIIFGDTVPGQDLIVDKILVDDVPIGSNPAGGGSTPNQPPTISNIADQAIPAGGTTSFKTDSGSSPSQKVTATEVYYQP